MSLNIWFTEVLPTQVGDFNITHNCGGYARALEIYSLLWEYGAVDTAEDYILPLTRAIVELETDPEKFRHLEPENGWGTVEQFASFLKEVRDLAVLHPNATVEISK